MVSKNELKELGRLRGAATAILGVMFMMFIIGAALILCGLRALNLPTQTIAQDPIFIIVGIVLVVIGGTCMHLTMAIDGYLSKQESRKVPPPMDPPGTRVIPQNIV